jgi:hypothetical protein
MVRQQTQCKTHWWPWWVWAGVLPCHLILWWYHTLKTFNRWIKVSSKAFSCPCCRWSALKLHSKLHRHSLGEEEDRIKVSILNSNNTTKRTLRGASNNINREEIQAFSSRDSRWTLEIWDFRGQWDSLWCLQWILTWDNFQLLKISLPQHQVKSQNLLKPQQLCQRKHQSLRDRCYREVPSCLKIYVRSISQSL